MAVVTRSAEVCFARLYSPGQRAACVTKGDTAACGQAVTIELPSREAAAGWWFVSAAVFNIPRLAQSAPHYRARPRRVGQAEQRVLSGQSGEAYGFPMEDGNLAKTCTIAADLFFCRSFAEGQIGGQA